MENRLTLAIVDAAHDEDPRAAGQSASCRYLTSIANVPLICHVLDDLCRHEIERVVVLAGPRAEQALTSVVGAGDAWGMRISFMNAGCETPRAAVVSQLRDATCDGASLLHAGDCLFPGQVSRLLERFHSEKLDLVTLARSTAPSAPVAIEDATWRHRIRLPRERPLGTAVILGPAVWPVLEELAREDSFGPSSVLTSLEAAGYRIGACDVGEHWCYWGSTEQLLIANRMMLDAIDPGPMPTIDCGVSHIEGRVAISPSASLARSTIRGPAVVGAGALVQDSFIGPYTSIGSGVKVVGAEIDNVVILDGAEVCYPGARLEASVIGERAVVSGTLSFPRAVHLHLGPDAQVILG
jgi:glucose-1-phosphate thymidylyltransferase